MSMSNISSSLLHLLYESPRTTWSIVYAPLLSGPLIKSAQEGEAPLPIVVSPSNTHDTSMHITKYPHTVRLIDGATPRLIPPLLATTENDTNVVLRIALA
jgi:hypothetical protein